MEPSDVKAEKSHLDQKQRVRAGSGTGIRPKGLQLTTPRHDIIQEEAPDREEEKKTTGVPERRSESLTVQPQGQNELAQKIPDEPVLPE